MKVLFSTYHIIFLCNNNIYFFPLTLRLYDVIKNLSGLSFIIVSIQLFKTSKCIIRFTFKSKNRIGKAFLKGRNGDYSVLIKGDIPDINISNLPFILCLIFSILGQWSIARFWMGEMEGEKKCEKEELIETSVTDTLGKSMLGKSTYGNWSSGNWFT